MKRTLGLSLLLCATLFLAGCPSVQMVGYTDPGQFARNLFKIAKDGSAAQWRTQLSEGRRAMGVDYATTHLAHWRDILLQLETTFGRPVEEVQFRVEGNALEFEFDKKWHLLFRVTNDPDGTLKINQD